MRPRTTLVIALAAILTVAAVVALRGHKPTTTIVANASTATTSSVAATPSGPSLADAHKAALDWVSSTDHLLAMGTIERAMWIAARVTPDAQDAMPGRSTMVFVGSAIGCRSRRANFDSSKSRSRVPHSRTARAHVLRCGASWFSGLNVSVHHESRGARPRFTSPPSMAVGV